MVFNIIRDWEDFASDEKRVNKVLLFLLGGSLIIGSIGGLFRNMFAGRFLFVILTFVSGVANIIFIISLLSLFIYNFRSIVKMINEDGDEK